MKYTDLDYSAGLENQLDVIQYLGIGQDKLAQSRKDEPKNRLRGGSTGALINGKIYGVCHRKAYLRYHGVNTPLEQEIELMTKQGEKNEEVWFDELLHGLPEDLYVMDQDQFDCKTEIEPGLEFSGSPDLVLFSRKTDQPVLGLELKNISSVSKVKSTHYELKPDSTHLIQAANYSLRMGDVFNLGQPLPYQLIYSSRSIWHVFAMSEKVKAPIVKAKYDVNFRFGRPMSIKPFHRAYHIGWTEDGRMQYWTAGYKKPVVTELTRESIDSYYKVVAQKIEEQNNLGPIPTTKNLDGSTGYSACTYCDFNVICSANDKIKPAEFKDQATLLVNEMWNNRMDHKS